MQLLRSRACGVLFTICLISPLFVISASAVNVRFMSPDGSEEYGSGMFADAFYTRYGDEMGEHLDDHQMLFVELVYYEYGDSFVITSESDILGWSYLPSQGTPDFVVGEQYDDSEIDYGNINLGLDELLPLYLVLKGNAPPAEPIPEPDFIPLARPINWNSGGNYSVSGYCDYTLMGDPDIKTNTQLFPISYPTTTQIVELAAQYNTFRPQITLQFVEDFRNVYYNLLVRQAWYVDGEIPANIQVNDVGLDGTITFENLLSNPNATTMYSLYSFDNSVDCTTTVDRSKGIIYFDYRISVYIPDTVQLGAHSGTRVRFDLKHKNTVSGLSIDTERSYTTLVSAYGNVTEEDMLAQVKYEAYRDKSNEKMQEGEAIIKDIESLVKPDPEQIVPDYLPDQEELQPITDAFSPFFQNALIVQLCTMVLGFAFVSYVLFGKKG